MSYIFDALQRSEGEQPGIDSVEPGEATELLRRAERRASTRWENGVHSKGNTATDRSELETPIGLREAAQIEAAPETTAGSEQLLAGKARDDFSQFKPLQIALPIPNRLVCFGDNESPAAESIRLLGVRLRNLRRERPLKKVLITSTVPQEGKSLIAANLACTLALTTQQKVLLLEGDLRRPSLCEKFGIGSNPGICECLKGARSLTDCVYSLEDAHLWIVPAGSAQSNALQLLQSGKLPAIMDQLEAWFDWIIIDSPPVLPLGDTSVWARLADGVLLVARQGTTEKRHLLKGLEAIESKKLIGALLNCSQGSSDYHYYYSGPKGSRTGDDRAN
jgi:capsular exopolysaccharide synthesis family protein